MLGAAPPQQFDLTGVLIAVGLMIGALIVLSVVLLAMRRRMIASSEDASSMGLFEEIRQLHAKGELTDEEFEEARRRMIERMKGSSTNGPQ